MSIIFQQGPGIVSGSPLSEEEYTCIVIQLGGQTILQKAPITGIRIDQQVDFSLSKTMAGNFNLVTFQDLPVTITIQGMISLYSPCDTEQNTQTLGQLYRRAKASGDFQPIQIVIGGTQVYYATIVALTQISSPDAPGLLTYNLTLFGVRADYKGEDKGEQD